MLESKHGVLRPDKITDSFPEKFFSDRRLHVLSFAIVIVFNTMIYLSSPLLDAGQILPRIGLTEIAVDVAQVFGLVFLTRVILGRLNVKCREAVLVGIYVIALLTGDLFSELSRLIQGSIDSLEYVQANAISDVVRPLLSMISKFSGFLFAVWAIKQYLRISLGKTFLAVVLAHAALVLILTTVFKLIG